MPLTAKSCHYCGESFYGHPHSVCCDRESCKQKSHQGQPKKNSKTRCCLKCDAIIAHPHWLCKSCRWLNREYEDTGNTIGLPILRYGKSAAL